MYIYMCTIRNGGWEGKGGKGEGHNHYRGYAIPLSCVMLLFFFFLPTVRVLFSTVKEYQFCTSQ